MILYQIVYGKVPNDLKYHVERTQSFAKDSQWDYELIEKPEIENPLARCAQSNWDRFNLMEEGRVYFDLDAYPTEDFTLESEYNFAHYPHNCSGAKPQPYSFIFSCPKKFAQTVLSGVQKKGIADQYCWPAKILRRYEKQISMIDPEHYVHDMYTARKHIFHKESHHE
ncbi:MAG: hypothetical protein GF334_02945 [Candidatus Altiarchaeales archaeon]|nr:hypothetical protein [Candidatus Altiarchaeales archaeon]